MARITIGVRLAQTSKSTIYPIFLLISVRTGARKEPVFSTACMDPCSAPGKRELISLSGERGWLRSDR